MIGGQRVSVVIPCRNEGSHINEVIKKIPSSVDEIVVVSNKSTDDTVEVAKNIGGRVKVFEDDRTLNGIGYGFAHITGINKATGDLIVAMDGDATYPIEDIEAIAEYLTINQLDFVSCNRYPLKDGTRVPFKLKFGVWLLNMETRLLYGVRIKDVLSGMWMFKREISENLNLTMGDWNLSPQIKINAAISDDISFGEFNIVQHSREGETKQNYLSTGVSHAVWILKNRLKNAKN